MFGVSRKNGARKTSEPAVCLFVHKEHKELICYYRNALHLTTMLSVGLLECFPVVWISSIRKESNVVSLSSHFTLCMPFESVAFVPVYPRFVNLHKFEDALFTSCLGIILSQSAASLNSSPPTLLTLSVHGSPSQVK